MTISVEVPALGESITEAIVAEWAVSEGDFVSQDQTLVELETDKITVAVPAPVAGVLKVQKAALDDTVNVGDVIAEIEPGSPPEGVTPKDTKNDEPKTAPTLELEPSAASDEASTKSAHKMSPAVERHLEENNLRPEDVKGTGPDGRILKHDVLETAAAKKQTQSRQAKAPRATGPEQTERVKMSRLRQTVAKRLVEAQQTAAMLTTFNEVDMSAVMALRSTYKQDFIDKHGKKLGFMSFFVKAVIEGLKEYPAVNSEIDGDEIVYKNFYHIGVAVGGPRGLVVPVVRNADQLGFSEVEQEIGRLAGLARDNRLALSDLQGGTFTISNGGVYGSMLSTPILNPPQVGILGMHNIVERPVVINGQVEVRPVMYLALSYDHRIIDGKEAVSFLVRVKECIEHPERILLEV